MMGKIRAFISFRPMSGQVIEAIRDNLESLAKIEPQTALMRGALVTTELLIFKQIVLVTLH